MSQPSKGIEIKAWSSLGAPGAGLTFPLKIHFELTNTRAALAFIEAKGFAFGQQVHPSPKAKLTRDGRYEYEFFKGADAKDPKKEIWEKSYLLEPGKTVKSHRR